MFLELLLQELDALPDDIELTEPQDVIGPNETVLFTLEDLKIKKVYHLSRAYHGRSIKLALETYDPTSNEQKAVPKECIKLKDRAEAIMEMFWAELREDDRTLARNLGIRKDWVVVDCPRQPEGILRMLGFELG